MMSLILNPVSILLKKIENLLFFVISQTKHLRVIIMIKLMV